MELQLKLGDGGIYIRPNWRRPQGGEFLAMHFTNSLVETLLTMPARMESPLLSTLSLSSTDCSLIWSWNNMVPPIIHECIHNLISAKALTQPTAEAVCSWDGTFSYLEVDQMSTYLAHYLISLGLQAGDIVPLNFEKSRWTVIAILAVMKCGAAFVLMDPKQPVQRRQTMASQVQAKFILTSSQYSESSSRIVPDAQIVGLCDELIRKPDPSTFTQPLPAVCPKSLMYIIFTSGTTGLPKGIMINHNTYTSGAVERQISVGYDGMSRVLDFTSYTFDVSIDSMLVTMLSGGCVCIPSDEDRMSDLSGSIRRLKVNMANMTPSVARVLDPDIFPSLRSLGIGGEACSIADISNWGKQTRIVIGYGVSECTTACTVNPSAAGKPYVSIGRASASTLWLVDPTDYTKLAPVGSVGEMLIEGPIVGEGYLGEPEKTAAAFIHDPPWLLAGDQKNGIPGRRGRLYRTGDLVRYDPDGDRGFIFIGRRDTQVKLRGQRIELSEIEYHVKSLLPSGAEVAADIVARGGRIQDSIIAAFINLGDELRPAKYARDDLSSIEQVEFPPNVQKIINSIEEKLSKVVPSYMVPSAYISVDRMPRLVSGKVDRKSLVALGVQATSRDASSASSNSIGDRVLSREEEILRQCWCSILDLDKEKVNATENFFNLGGDSIRAMKLAPKLREMDFIITVVDIFDYPVLSDMAKAMKRRDTTLCDVVSEVPPFSLVSRASNIDALLDEAAEQCCIERASIEDIYPCAPMQEIHMAFYTRSKKGFVAQRVADVPNWSSMDRVKAAWEYVYRNSAILRTRIVEFSNHGFMQVVTTGEISWKSGTHLETFLEEDKNEAMLASSPMCRFATVYDEKAGKGYLVWTTHHAIYDGWSVDLILDRVRAAYTNNHLTRPTEFKHFIRWLNDPARDASKAYWEKQLEGATGPKFPGIPSRSFIPEPDSRATKYVRINENDKSNFTIAVIIRAAWSLLSSAYTMSDDVVFAETFVGRAIPIDGALEIEGPMLSSIPTRIRIDRTAVVHELLQSIQDQSALRGQHEHLGFQNIRRLSDDAQIACEVAMGLIIQPPTVEPASPSGDHMPSFRQGDMVQEALNFSTYPLMLACGLERDGFRVEASFDSRIITPIQMQRVLGQLAHIVTQLLKSPTRIISKIPLVTPGELQTIQQTNDVGRHGISQVPTNGTTGMLRNGNRYPAPPKPSWVVHPFHHSILVPIGAVGELVLEDIGQDSRAADLDAPSWLAEGAEDVLGRNKRLSGTGDLVRYRDDMTLEFVSRKETLKAIDGHVVDLAAIDSALDHLLPKSSAAKSHSIVLKDTENQDSVTVVFIQETPSETTRMIQLDTSLSERPLHLSSSVSEHLARIIVGLDKTIFESLPPYAIPSLWVPVCIGSAMDEPIDITSAEWAVWFLTPDLVRDLRHAYSCLRKKLIQLSPALTKKELIMRSIWSRLLGIEEDKISLDDNFFRLGGDSIVTMRLISALRKSAYHISIAEVFQHMKLRDMAAIITPIRQDLSRPAKVYIPFSLLHCQDVDTFLSEAIKPHLQDPTWEIEDILPTTGPQTRDVDCTVFAPRSAVQYTVLYLQKSVEMSLLIACFRRLVSQHPILRTVFVQYENQLLQAVIKDTQLNVSEHNTLGPMDVYCKDMVRIDADNDAEFNFGALYLKLFVVYGLDENALIIRLSHAQYDGVSLTRLLQQLELQYRKSEAPQSPSFGVYMQYTQDSKADNIKYWRGVLDQSMPAEIPTEITNGRPIFLTRSIDTSNYSAKTTWAVLLTAGWAKVLSQTLKSTDVTFAGVVSGRDGILADIDSIMGPCYQYIPIRVRFKPAWKISQLLECVRNQYLEGSSRATLSFEEIKTECAQWAESSTFYPSFVNHINKEFFDILPFADTQYRIDSYTPHAERSTPPRAIIFTENDNIVIGIEADECRKQFWQGILNDLANIVESFIRDPEALL